MAHTHAGHYTDCSGTHEHCGCEARMYCRVIMYAAAFCITSLGAGLLSGSLSLMTDCLHFATDAAGYLIALGVVTLRMHGKDSSFVRTIAWFLIGATLIFFVFTAGESAFMRIMTPHLVIGPFVIVVALFGCLVSKMQHDELARDLGHAGADLREGNRLHALGDMVFSLVIALGGLATTFTHIAWIDPALSLVAAIWILHEVAKYLRRGPNHLPVAQSH